MTRAHKVLGFLLVTLVGIYGCAKGPAPTPTTTNTPTTESKSNPALEAKIHRLEDDFKAAAASRDALRQKLTAAEDQQARLQRQADQAKQEAVVAAQERDALRNEIKTRTTERDDVKSQYATYIKSVREQADKAEAAMNNGNNPVMDGGASAGPIGRK